MSIFENLEPDIKSALKAQLRDLWTHTSTAIEGNTLTLGETKFVIEEGLTVSGKPLKDHQEVIGHARAIDLVYGLVAKDKIAESDLFELHGAVLNQAVIDVYKPIGAWKLEPNGSYYFNERTQKQEFYEYSSPQDTPALMAEWIVEFNRLTALSLNREEALQAYTELHLSFVCIHPFFDGNGRIARLVSNIPVLKSSHPPILIPKERRKQYIETLVGYQVQAGITTPGKPLILKSEGLDVFTKFCSECWGSFLELVDKAHNIQAERDQAAGISRVVEKITDPRVRIDIVGHLRAIKNLERAGGAIKERPAVNQQPSQKEIAFQLEERIKAAKKLIKEAKMGPDAKKAVLKIIDHKNETEKSF